MLVEIKVPKFSPTLEEATLVKWHKKEGDWVKKGEILFEISALKVNMEVEAPCEGRLTKINVEEGNRVKVGDVVANIEEIGAEKADSAQPSNEETLTCDIAILGGGPGGYVAAIKAAQLGAKVVLIEKDKLGGTCLNRGCIPTKTLAKSAKIIDYVKRAQEYGIKIADFDISYEKIMERKNNVVYSLRNGIEGLLIANKVNFLHGTAKLLNKNTVEVIKENKRIIVKAERGIILATGSRPAVLPIPGMDLPGVLNSDEILENTVLPANLVIIGGGVIGMEYAFIFNSLGVKVTVIELMPRILPNMDEEISEGLKNVAEKKGIKVVTSAKVVKIEQVENGGLAVFAEVKGESKIFTSDKVFISIGRAINSEGLGLQDLGIEMVKSAVKVDEHMMTSVEGVYAVGDLTGGLMLAHVASKEGIIAAENIMGIKSKMEFENIPSAVFTHPEIASVGLTEVQAKEKGYDVKVGKFYYLASGKAKADGEEEGFVKIISDKSTGKILGVHILGEDAADLIHEAKVAIERGMTAKELAEVVHAHPTYSECIMEAAHAAFDRPIHSV